jgi:hypothetical protein
MKVLLLLKERSVHKDLDGSYRTQNLSQVEEDILDHIDTLVFFECLTFPYHMNLKLRKLKELS